MQRLLTQMLMVSSNGKLVNKDSMLQLVRYCAESKDCTSSANKNHLGLEVLLLEQETLLVCLMVCLLLKGMG